MAGTRADIARIRPFLLLAIFLLWACDAQQNVQSPIDAVPSLTPVWMAEGVFTSPESAIYDPARDAIYVSNVNGYTTNGLGYLSALSIDGEILEEKWLEGVNAPTGMAINGDTLFVADFDRVAEIDIPSRTIRRFYNAPDENPGVNDLALSPTGELFVSASAVSAIYKLEGEALAPWARSEALKFANGLYADDEHLYVAGFYLRRIDLVSKKIESFGDDAVLEDLESIEAAPDGGYFVTMIGEKPIMHVSDAGEITPVLERSTFSADIEVVPNRRLLIAPSGGDSVSGFAIN